MKTFFLIVLTFFYSAAFAQETDLQAFTKPIVDEGKMLYRSEMASWFGTDVFLESYKNRENIGGYFSYINNGVPTCVFMAKTEKPVVIGTILFDSTYNVQTAKLDLKERELTSTEMDYFVIRKNALELIRKDTLFKTYKNTSLNLIPIIQGNEKKVYVLTGTSQTGIVLFGNDYLISFDKENNITGRKKIHQNIIPIDFNKNSESEDAIHMHLPETGDFITATDICTLMLYEKMANWKQHNVVSEKYLSIWDCEKNELTVITMDAVRKISEDQEKRHPKEKKKD